MRRAHACRAVSRCRFPQTVTIENLVRIAILEILSKQKLSGDFFQHNARCFRMAIIHEVLRSIIALNHGTGPCYTTWAL
jgi:hypothetical protein